MARIRDTASGYTLDRPGMNQVRQLLRQGAVDVLLAHAVDRLSRNQNHIGVLFDEVQQAGVRLECVTEKFEDTPEGRFILAARAFIAEVERAKIIERTTRGKTVRARAGKLPQATGKGLYGYRYDPKTGRRTADPFETAVVRRVFTEFVGGASLVGIANHLNAEGISTFTGRAWSPATLYHMLRNETYTGRTVYRRTVVQQVRDPRSGRRRRTVTVRDSSQWIEVPDATPAIVDAELFAAVERLLDDPERRRRGRRIHDYPLASRLQCLQCGRAMVGQTLQGRYRYYRCRRAFAGPKHDRCATRYVRAHDLEQAVREAVGQVLADPTIIIAEHERLRAGGGTTERRAMLERQLAQLDEQKRRLAKLYQLGDVDDAYLESELRALRARRAVAEEELQGLRQEAAMPPIADLKRACAQVRDWVAGAVGEDFALLTEALQLGIRAETDRGELSGIIPDDVRGYAPACSDAHVRPVVRRPGGYPFRLPFQSLPNGVKSVTGVVIPPVVQPMDALPGVPPLVRPHPPFRASTMVVQARFCFAPIACLPCYRVCYRADACHVRRTNATCAFGDDLRRTDSPELPLSLASVGPTSRKGKAQSIWGNRHRTRPRDNRRS